MIGTVNFYRGLRHAEASASPLAVIAGRNAAGKSSYCEAMQAALTGNPLPLRLAKKDARLLVNDAAEAGCAAAAVRSDDYDAGKGGLASVAWPRAEVVTEGQPPSSSPVAVGLVRPLDLDHKARAALLIETLGASPSRDDLLEALRLQVDPLGRAPLPDDVKAALWTAIEQNGWDATHAEHIEYGQKLKGHWEQISGQNFGAKRAANFRPDGWTADLDTTSEQALRQQLAEATGLRDAQIYRTCNDAATIEQVKRRLVELNEIAAKAEEGRDALRAAEAEQEEADAAFAGAPDPGGDSGAQCPHCGGRIRLVRGAGKSAGHYLFEPGADPVDRDEFDQRDQARRAAKKRLDEARSRADRTRRALAKVEAAAEEHGKLREQLEQLKGGEPETNAAGLASQQVLERAQARLALVETLRKANDVAIEIGRQVAIVRLLSPTGLRQEKLAERMQALNDRLREFAAVAEWPVLWLTPELDFLLHNRPEALWSASERYRSNLLLQVALSQESEPLIIDAFDILDQAGRNGALMLLMQTKRTAVIAMTINRRDLVPDLRAAGIGNSYWIEDGEMIPLWQSALAAE